MNKRPKVGQLTRTQIAALADAKEELQLACKMWPRFNTAHEGYAILLEEVDELWDIVKMKPSRRDSIKMRAEAIQVAAMALRFAIECCESESK